jgi:hypothetical protein
MKFRSSRLSWVFFFWASGLSWVFLFKNGNQRQWAFFFARERQWAFCTEAYDHIGPVYEESIRTIRLGQLKPTMKKYREKKHAHGASSAAVLDTSQSHASGPSLKKNTTKSERRHQPYKRAPRRAAAAVSPPPPAPMAAAPSRCLLVTGPPVIHNPPELRQNPLCPGPLALTTALLLAGRGEDDAGHAAGGSPQSIPSAPQCSRILHPYCHLRSPSPGSFVCAVDPPKFHPSSWYLFVGEVRENGERVGFEVVTLDGRTGRLASSKISRCLQLLLKSISDGYFSSAIRSLVLFDTNLISKLHYTWN